METTMTDQDAGVLLGILATFGLAILIIILVLYLIDAIARFKYLKIRNYPKAWLAFIPAFNVFACIEATYGNVETVKLFSFDVPLTAFKLYPIILSVISGLAGRIEAIRTPVTSVVGILTVAFGVIVLRDMLSRLDKNVSVGFSVLANIITIVGSITLLSACKNFAPGQLDYTTDTRPLPSQDTPDNPVPPQQ
jgi:hypothetical protein